MCVGERYKEGRYTVLQKLGWGHFSTVWLVSDANTGGQAALKVQVVGSTPPLHPHKDEMAIVSLGWGPLPHSGWSHMRRPPVRRRW